MTIVSLTTDLPLSAARVRELAAVPEVMQFVLAPVLSFSMEQAPPPDAAVTPGFRARGRVRWLGVIPSWTHQIEIVRLDDLEIYTRERGGPVHVWNHRLTFEPTSATTCRYTDEVEVESGARGLVAATFVRLMFRHRHRRWRLLVSVLAAERDRTGAGRPG
ncbi:hypothetical protein [Gordonia sp. NB41Y]|uniref:hypothetical protein n=1 Tax=Gordonia sp. NB41Y TaxID=875808 RepID=UPI0006B1C710|nr:hypothetical protein [Gordonia sp. NB41Y]KOY49960.1 hypothetical protein ISGA_06840 [Gordonia sp. NB41Y]WLP88926.1 hypothetical protein Q9K23_15075 [Gordonia sp. NB41Y]